MPYLKIPFSNTAGTLGATIGGALGQVSEKGNLALDKVEDILANGRLDISNIKLSIRATQDRANQEASILLERAVQSLSTNRVESAYERFLARTVDTPVASAVATLPAGLGGVAEAILAALKEEGKEAVVNLSDQAKGKILALAQKEADELREKAQKEVEAFLDKNQDIIENVKENADKILGGIEDSLTAIITVTNTIKATVTATKVPIEALQVAVTVLKTALGLLPQRWLLVIFTIIQQETLDTLGELIQQALEIISALESILANVESTLTQLRDRIRRIRASLNLFLIDGVLSGAANSDWDILSEAGLLDEDGNSVFDIIGEGLEDGSDWKGYGVDDDLTRPEIGNQILIGDVGDYVDIPGVIDGAYFEEYYTWSEEKPKVPQGRVPEKEGWYLKPRPINTRLENQDLWMTRVQVVYGHPVGPYSDPVRVSYDDIMGRKIFETKSLRVPIIDGTTLNLRPGIIKTPSWEMTLEQALGNLKDLPLSKKLQDKLIDLWDIETSYEAGTATLEEGKVAYTTKSGETFYLEIVEDSKSPKVATRRFVRVTDVGDVVILEGTKTFSLDKEALLTEMKLELELLTR